MAPINLNKNPETRAMIQRRGLGSQYMNYAKDDWRFQQFYKINKTNGPARFHGPSLRKAAGAHIAEQNRMLMGTDIFKTTREARSTFKNKSAGILKKAGAVGRVGFSVLGGVFAGIAVKEGYEQGGTVGAAGGLSSFYLMNTIFSTGTAMVGARVGGMAAMAQAGFAGLNAPLVALAAVGIGLRYIHDTGRDARQKMEFGEPLIENQMTATMRGRAYQGMMGTRQRISASTQYTSHRRERIVDSLGDEAVYMHL